MLKAQGGRCAICGADKPTKRKGDAFRIDHCHATGAVRERGVRRVLERK
ncbi:MAG: endonuclease domain-containing protein, partial [Longimicrobiales bacterium]